MGIWTDSNGQRWNINIGGQALSEIQRNPDFKFCWVNDTPDIAQRKDASDKNVDANAKNVDANAKNVDANAKNVVTVKCADGSTAIGKIFHWVNGKSDNRNLESYYFILCTKKN